jgi:predicted metal-dependent enzyme (double-stranded beta helix superfamily)
MDLFERMGRTLSQRWRAGHHARDAFPDLALQAIHEARAHEAITPTALLRWVFEQDTLPPQADLDARFGKPPITLFYDDLFSISALFWVDGSTTIHQHAFSGAFSVLEGSSVHARYDFEKHATVSEAVVRGTLTAGGVELLKKGDAHAIYAGPQFIHALFHLDRPSVSLVVRTHSDGYAGPQYSYSRSGLGVDGHFEPPTLTKQLQALTMMLKTGDAQTSAMVRAWMSRADAHTAFQVLSVIDGRAKLDLFTEALAVLDKRDSSLASSIGDAILREREAREIVSLRSDIADPELRYFLALLLNVESRTRILQLVAARYCDGDVHERVDRWLDALVSTLAERARRSEKSGSETTFAVASLSPRDRWALGRFIRGESDDAIADRASRGEAPGGAAMAASESAKLRFVLSFTSLLRPLVRE